MENFLKNPRILQGEKSVCVFYAKVVFCHDGLEFVAGPGDVFAGALLAVYDADDFFYRRSGFGNDFSRFENLSAGRGDVLYQQDDVAGF